VIKDKHAILKEGRYGQLKTLSITVPDYLAERIQDYVRSGFFVSEPDVILAAISEFVRRNRIDLMERFAREDIAWAKTEAHAAQ
jgi:Arc/MetJ-type ribon-helix-helix transcriptional regulator